LATLSGTPFSSSSLGSLFQLPTLLGFSLQSFSPPVNRKKGFPLSPFVPALSSKTFPALNRRSDDFFLTNSHSPSLLPEGLAQVGGVGSLGFFHLSGSLSLYTAEESISLSSSPLSTFLHLFSHKKDFIGPQGLFDLEGSASSITGRRPVGCS